MGKTAPALLLCLFLSGGCNKPRIDACTDARMQESLARVRASLPRRKRKEFDDAIQIVLLDKLNLVGLSLADGKPAIGETEEEIKSGVHGKTGHEIIAAAIALRRQRQAEARDRALAELRGLERKKAAARRAARELERFEVRQSLFYKKEGTFGMGEPIIELTVRNGTGRAVFRAYFEGVLASPGRAIPWLRESFYYDIPGGLEPGEEVTWRLMPSGFSAWGRVQAPGDAVLSVKVTRLDGPDEKKLFSSMEFTEADRKRLSELQASVRARRMSERD